MSAVTEIKELNKKDFVSDADVRWCPGCGDYAILNVMQKVLPKLGIAKEDFVVVSGIGCSSRFPYYMDTYGFHTIHGRAPTFATGVKVANPALSVWLITGDGDALSIGGNHLLHMLRRNPNINVLLFNNQIYGLTKGQYSPTSEVGKVTKTSPLGSPEREINPISYALSAGATFIARTLDTDPNHMAEIFEQAAKHQGTSFIEIFQNCVIFNNKTFEPITGRDVKKDYLLELKHGEKLIFGSERDKGIRLNGLDLEVVTIGEGVEVEDIITHDSSNKNPSYSYMLSQLAYPAEPTPIGVFRSIEGVATYEDILLEQSKNSVASKGKGNLQSILNGADSWVVK